MGLRVSDNHRFLCHDDGAPFFYLGDTAWELFHRLTVEEADLYLRNRAARGFTVIQAVALAELDGLGAANAYGDHPLEGRDPRRPVEAYFRVVDTVVARANELGLHVGLLPTWGSHMLDGLLADPEVAWSYGQFLGARYPDAEVIWILGGDRSPEGYESAWRALAEGLAAGDGGTHLRTYHPNGWAASSTHLHQEAWLDFNMVQSGHSIKDEPNWKFMEHDYALTPTKPCMDAEPRYEDHPVDWAPAKGWFDAFDVRQAAYWALFAGAHGHTYGCHDVWQFWAPGREPIAHARTPWPEAIKLPAAAQMQHARALLEGRSYFDRVPDQSLIRGGQEEGPGHLRATRSAAGAWALVYSPLGRPFELDLGGLARPLAAQWFDPRTGVPQAGPRVSRAATQTFAPPAERPGKRGEDWVLVLQSAGKQRRRGRLPPDVVGARAPRVRAPWASG